MSLREFKRIGHVAIKEDIIFKARYSSVLSHDILATEERKLSSATKVYTNSITRGVIHLKFLV